MQGKVIDLGYFGKDSLYRVKLDSGDLVAVNSVNERRAGEGERVAVWEDEVWLSFEPSAAIVLRSSPWRDIAAHGSTRPEPRPKAGWHGLARPQGLARFHHRHALCLAARSSSSLPFFIVLAISFAQVATGGIPPFVFKPKWPYVDFDNYAPPVHRRHSICRAISISVNNAAIATFFCLLIGYPMALGIARAAAPGATSCCSW